MNRKNFVRQPWVTGASVGICVVVFLGLLLKNDYQNPETLAKFGNLSAGEIWRGGYWALVTSAFVHFTLWHIAFNLYWLWTLGRRMEKEIGSLAYLAFFVVAAFVSSTCQMAFTDSTGIGASGVVYALFGFMWVTRGKYPTFATILDDRTIKTFLIWFVGCIVATILNLWAIGNWAHGSGLLFGAAVGGALGLRYRPYLTVPGLTALVGASVALLFWCPWSVVWLSEKAYAAHVAKNYPEALRLYARVLERNPGDAWAHRNRGEVYGALGREREAAEEFDKAARLDPDSVKE